jgi:regulator of sigma E protease
VIDSIPISLASFILILVFLLCAYALGHLIVAKVLGGHVSSLVVGFGPTIVAFTVGRSRFTFGLLPFGSSVTIDNLNALPNFSRILVIAAGPLATCAVALLCFTAAIASYGRPVPSVQARVGAVSDPSAAEVAGIRAEDVVIAVDQHRVDGWDDLVAALLGRRGQSVLLSISRDGVTTTVCMLAADGYHADRAAQLLGRESIDGMIRAEQRIRVEALQSLRYGFLQMISFGEGGFLSLGQMIVGTKRGGDWLPVNKSKGAQLGVLNGLQLFASVAISLSILNLLPFPLLNGGSIVGILFESIVRQPISGRAREIGLRIGISMLVVLTLVALYHDLHRLFSTAPHFEASCQGPKDQSL